MPDIDHVSLTFGNGVKRSDFDPIKKCEVTISARVGENEDGVVILAQIGTIAIAKVADMLSAPKPSAENPAAISAEPAEEAAPPKRRPGRPPKDAAPTAEPAPASEAPETQSETAPASQPPSDDWSGSAPEISDDQILKATSAKAQEHGNDPEFRKKISLLIGTFDPNNGQGPQFKVQSIGQPQRQDYLTKLAALG